MEHPHVQEEIHLQRVHFPASYVSLPEGIITLSSIEIMVNIEELGVGGVTERGIERGQLRG